ncbi:galactose mutarotase-like domain-containing protein [Myxozyma melibiosi]|uniref:Glucose-6-phosphate 1-epimerase n=1 Tax=Myxozyma melibiosi TaxID=54550 RepID=A0ABR1FDX6_9ASCO
MAEVRPHARFLMKHCFQKLLSHRSSSLVFRKQPLFSSTSFIRSFNHISTMPIDQTEKDVTLTYAGSSVKVLLHGANILSWKVNGAEKLFLSEGAILDGSKAVRGGVPLVFPVFGKATSGPTATLPQHGFARLSTWEFLGQTTESPLAVQFGLGPENVSEELRSAWPYNFTLIYTVSLGEDTLETSLSISNPGDVAWDFQTLLHTYFYIPDVDKVAVTGLTGTEVKDKVTKTDYSESNEDVTIAAEVDRVYENVPKPVTIKSDGKTLFEITRKNLDDVVVWNPWTNCVKMGDFKPVTGYKNMICVEAGSVSKWTSLAPGETYVAVETVKAYL